MAEALTSGDPCYARDRSHAPCPTPPRPWASGRVSYSRVHVRRAFKRAYRPIRAIRPSSSRPKSECTQHGRTTTPVRVRPSSCRPRTTRAASSSCSGRPREPLARGAPLQRHAQVVVSERDDHGEGGFRPRQDRHAVGLDHRGRLHHELSPGRPPPCARGKVRMRRPTAAARD